MKHVNLGQFMKNLYVADKLAAREYESFLVKYCYGWTLPRTQLNIL